MPEKWTGRLIGRMHNEGVTYDDLGAELGICKAYVCQILNGRRKPKDIQKKMENALDAIVARRAEEDV